MNDTPTAPLLPEGRGEGSSQNRKRAPLPVAGSQGEATSSIQGEKGWCGDVERKEESKTTSFGGGRWDR